MFISYLDDRMESMPITFVCAADMLEDKLRKFKMILKVRNIVQDKIKINRD